MDNGSAYESCKIKSGEINYNQNEDHSAHIRILHPTYDDCHKHGKSRQHQMIG